MDHKLIIDATKLVAGYDTMWPTDRFVHQALSWLCRKNPYIRCEFEATAHSMPAYWRVTIPDDDMPNDDIPIICVGNTLEEAIAHTVLCMMNPGHETKNKS